MPLLAPLPATPFELAEWKQTTVQFNYHIAVDRMFCSMPYQYINNKINVRITDTTVEIFYDHNRVVSHRCIHRRSDQYLFYCKRTYATRTPEISGMKWCRFRK